MDGLILIPIFLPVIAGAAFLISSLLEHVKGLVKLEGSREPGSSEDPENAEDLKSAWEPENLGDSEGSAERQNHQLKWFHVLFVTVLSVSAAAALCLAWSGERSVTLFTLVEGIPVFLRIDDVGRVFVTVVSVIWLLTGVYSLVYMGHEGDEKRYFGFYLLLYGVLVGLDFSGNMVTMYLFYELMTLASFPLVLHNGTREAIMAALKYLFYSMCGAYAGLFGIYFLYQFSDSLTFTAGGTLGAGAQGNEGILLAAVFVMLVGFGAKAGMLPLHAWLPAAHPAAPSPASAVLSAIIVKSGVLAVIRVVYYIVGPGFIRGTWVQYTWMSLTLITVFMGSLLAFREKVFKKRLAYSTVSQVSYILFGLSLLSPTGFEGALLHVVGHAVIKCGLFLTAGVFLYQFGYTRIEQLTGIGKKMPVTMWCYTLFSLGLVGIPPTVGFISKWYLAEGSLRLGNVFGVPPVVSSEWIIDDIGVFSWLGPVVLLLSALMTAGYLLPVAMRGFFPGEEAQGKDSTRQEPSLCMLLPLVLLAALTLLLGIWPGPLEAFVRGIANGLSM